MTKEERDKLINDCATEVVNARILKFCEYLLSKQLSKT